MRHRLATTLVGALLVVAVSAAVPTASAMPAPDPGTTFALSSGLGISSWGAGRLDVFALGADNAIWHKWFDVGSWSRWESLGGGLTSDPAAVSWGNGRIDLFARGLDYALWHKWYDKDGWHDWQSLGGYLISGPAVSSWGSGRLDVFAIGGDHALYHKAFDGNWNAWENLGGYLTSDPAAVSWGPDRIDVFARGVDNSLYHKWWSSGWSGWESLGGVLTSGPGASSWGPNRIDVFVRSTDNAAYHKVFNGVWNGWEYQGGQLTSDPDAVSWSGSRVDVVARGADGGGYHKAWDGVWHDWESLDSYPSPAQTVFLTRTNTYVDFTNNDGTWRVYTTCADNAGPGYVAKMTTKAGRVFFNDSTGSQAQVGLGKFIFRIARAAQNALLVHDPSKGTVNTYHMDGKQCAGINATSTGAWNAGVNNGASGLVGGPAYQASGDFGWLWENVVFQDPYGNVLRVLYKWRVYGNYLKVWADVVEMCNGGPNGSCGSPAAWLKGPKFTAGVNGWPDGAGFTQMTTYDDAGSVVCTPQDYNDPGVNSNRPCAAATRSRLQFNYTDPQNPPLTGPPNCFSYQRCFNAIFRSYVPDATLGSITPDRYADYWTGPGGLDAWARTADSYAQQGAANTCTQTAPSQARQWESGGWKYDANGDGYVTYLDRYSSANGNFFGWRDCVNVEDDPALYRALHVEQWGTYASFSFNYDGVNYFPQTMRG